MAESSEKKIDAPFATADDFLNTPDAVFTEVDAPELSGKKIRVKIPDANQLEALDAADLFYDDNGRPHQVPGRFARWALACAVNADGTPMFSPEQIDLLKKKCGTLLRRIFYAASSRMPDLTPKAVREEVKN